MKTLGPEKIDRHKIDRAARCLKAMAHPIRLQILCALKDGEKNVQQLERMLGTSQANMSQHLRILRDKDILASRKDGNQVFYAVSNKQTFSFLQLLQEIYCKP